MSEEGKVSDPRTTQDIERLRANDNDLYEKDRGIRERVTALEVTNKRLEENSTKIDNHNNRIIVLENSEASESKEQTELKKRVTALEKNQYIAYGVVLVIAVVVPIIIDKIF